MKFIPGDYLMKLVERMPRVCKAVIKAKSDVGGPPEGRLGSRIVAQQGMGDKVTRGN